MCGGGVVGCGGGGGGVRGFAVVVECPEEGEGESHCQDLRHADGHTQETQHLQLLGAADETEHLWPTSLKTHTHTHTAIDID